MGGTVRGEPSARQGNVIDIDTEVCVLCGLCTGVCPPNALELTPTRLQVRSHCTSCGWCVPYCPVGAISGGRAVARPRRRDD